VPKEHERDFREWAHARRDRLRRAAFLLSGDWHLADDLTQTTLTKMFVAWPRIRGAEGPDAFAHRVLVNAFVDDRRRPWRRERGTAELPDAPARDGTDAVLDRQVVLAALARLPARQRAVIVLRFWEDLSIDQTAAVMSCSPGTIKSQTAKAQQHLREHLGSRLDLLPTSPTTVEA
jgi:RNA polymerase sigma-70 factor (sigma-E family)